MLVKKRDGRFVPFNSAKIDAAVGRACKELGVDPIVLTNTPEIIKSQPLDPETHKDITEYSFLHHGGINVNHPALKKYEPLSIDWPSDTDADMATNVVDKEKDMELSKIGDLRVLVRINDNGQMYMDIEDIQDTVELALMTRHPYVAQAYIRYRHTRMMQRNVGHNILDDIGRITNLKAVDNEAGRDNANVNEDVTMGWMLHAGEIATKAYFLRFRLKEEWSQAHIDGKTHIHDLAWYDKSINCLQIDVGTLMSKRFTEEELEAKFWEEMKNHDGDSNIAGAITHKFELDRSTFSTGHGTIRIPSAFKTAMSLTAVIIQANQNDNYGGQGVPGIDYQLEKFVHVDFRKELAAVLTEQLYIAGKLDVSIKDQIKDDMKNIVDPYNNTDAALPVLLKHVPLIIAKRLIEVAYTNTRENVMQACEGFIHNLNTMSSRAGAQVPFSSITLGMNTRESGRIITEGILKSLMAGLGQGETAIFPITIFVTKEGVNCLKGDPNYDLYQYSMQCSAKRLYPTYIFLDAPCNLAYYREDDPRSFAAQMGCRTRVLSNVNGEATSLGRGNLSATTLNLPGIALETVTDIHFGEVVGPEAMFFGKLDKYLLICEEQLIDRYKGQCALHGYNMPMTLGENLYLGSDKVGRSDTAEEALKHGTLVIGYCGLAECLVALTGKHHGEAMTSQKLGLEIVRHIKEFTDHLTEKYHLNFATFATPAESTAGRFAAIDQKKYPIIKGVNDKDYYTNSNHVPVDFEISAYEKIAIEGPYHSLTLAGNISYVELDGDLGNNLEAFETILKHMRECGVQYGAANTPVDRCNFCNHTGVIHDECPLCHYIANGYYDENIHRIRRITGYLTGDVHNRFNDAKKAEERDRVKHELKFDYI